MVDDDAIKRMFPASENNHLPPQPESTPQKRIYDYSKSKAQKAIEEKKAELELKKLEIEIQKLQTPTTNIDYFQKMLELQDNHFQQLLQMQQKQNELQLKITELENRNEGDGDSWIFDLLPAIPELLKARNAQTQPAQQVQKEVFEVKKPTEAELYEYKMKIRAGQITFEQFLEDAKKTYPELISKISLERIKEEYDKIKNS